MGTRGSVSGIGWVTWAPMNGLMEGGRQLRDSSWVCSLPCLGGGTRLVGGHWRVQNPREGAIPGIWDRTSWPVSGQRGTRAIQRVRARQTQKIPIPAGGHCVGNHCLPGGADKQARVAGSDPPHRPRPTGDASWLVGRRHLEQWVARIPFVPACPSPSERGKRQQGPPDQAGAEVDACL